MRATTSASQASGSVRRDARAVAEHEGKMIGERTKAALAAAKARGVRLGGDPRNLDGVRERGAVASAKARGEKADRRAQDVMPIVLELQSAGASLRRIADELTARGIPTARGGQIWTAGGCEARGGEGGGLGSKSAKSGAAARRQRQFPEALLCADTA